MDLLARREHGTGELTRKLIQKGMPEELVHQAVDRLAEDGLISDLRYCESMINSHYQRGQGPNKIRYKLRSQGVSDITIDTVMEMLSPDWEQALVRLIDKKYPGNSDRTPSERAKQVRFLSSRGFPQDMIFRCLQGRGSETF